MAFWTIAILRGSEMSASSWALFGILAGPFLLGPVARDKLRLDSLLLAIYNAPIFKVIL